MSLRSKARRAGPENPDYTRTSAHALDLDNYVPAYLTYLAGKISNSASALPLGGSWRCLPLSHGFPQAAFAT